MKNFMTLIAVSTLLFLSSCSGEERAWQDVKTRNTVSDFEQFIEAYPQSIFKDSATFKIEELSLIQIGENEQLAKEYEYLNGVSNDRLNILHLNFKNECIKQNKQNHPMLRALMIVRKKRGLD